MITSALTFRGISLYHNPLEFELTHILLHPWWWNFALEKDVFKKLVQTRGLLQKNAWSQKPQKWVCRGGFKEKFDFLKVWFQFFTIRGIGISAPQLQDSLSLSLLPHSLFISLSLLRFFLPPCDRCHANSRSIHLTTGNCLLLLSNQTGDERVRLKKCQGFVCLFGMTCKNVFESLQFISLFNTLITFFALSILIQVRSFIIKIIFC